MLSSGGFGVPSSPRLIGRAVLPIAALASGRRRGSTLNAIRARLYLDQQYPPRFGRQDPQPPDIGRDPRRRWGDPSTSRGPRSSSPPPRPIINVHVLDSAAGGWRDDRRGRLLRRDPPRMTGAGRELLLQKPALCRLRRRAEPIPGALFPPKENPATREDGDVSARQRARLAALAKSAATACDVSGHRSTPGRMVLYFLTDSAACALPKSSTTARTALRPSGRRRFRPVTRFSECVDYLLSPSALPLAWTAIPRRRRGCGR